MKHCGKSTLGRKIARLYCCPFFDTDILIEKDFESETGRKLTVRQIMEKFGEDEFEKREAVVVKRLHGQLLGRQDGDSAIEESWVIALGGRTPLNCWLSSVLKELGINIYLKVGMAETRNRIYRSGKPAFLKSVAQEEELVALYQEREPVYSWHADIILPLDGLGPKKAFMKLRELLESERAHAR
jgi:shikimate kinase